MVKDMPVQVRVGKHGGRFVFIRSEEQLSTLLLVSTNFGIRLGQT